MKYVAKVHFRRNGFLTYIKGECELDEQGEPKKDKEFLYLKVEKVPRKAIINLEIIEVPDYEEDPQAIPR